MEQLKLGDVDTDMLNGFDVPEGACVNYRDCGNVPPGNNMMCGECLDRVRHADQ